MFSWLIQVMSTLAECDNVTLTIEWSWVQFDLPGKCLVFLKVKDLNKQIQFKKEDLQKISVESKRVAVLKPGLNILYFYRWTNKKRPLDSPVYMKLVLVPTGIQVNQSLCYWLLYHRHFDKLSRLWYHSNCETLNFQDLEVKAASPESQKMEDRLFSFTMPKIRTIDATLIFREVTTSGKIDKWLQNPGKEKK